MARNPWEERTPTENGGRDWSSSRLFNMRDHQWGKPSCIETPSDQSFGFQQTVSCQCPFSYKIFLKVMLNLINNPNITSSHLFRADILYDSVNDASYTPRDPFVKPQLLNPTDLSSFVSHMQPSFRPRLLKIEHYRLSRTIVRELVPRNPKMDRKLVQTCHILEPCWTPFKTPDLIDGKIGPDAFEHIVLYLPHVDVEEDMPWYHPKLKALAFLYSSSKQGSRVSQDLNEAPGTMDLSENDYSSLFSTKISLHVAPFLPSQTNVTIPSCTAESEEDAVKLTFRNSREYRTLKNILSTIHRHGVGQMHGYKKRVQHDVILAQRQFQDTYTRLKFKYGKQLSDSWQEVTDPTKHVFEDLGIAAFLIELWNDMYDLARLDKLENPENSLSAQGKNDDNLEAQNRPGQPQKQPFPGFVDLACGNGVLVHILRSEGYPGWGFDARHRKSWDAFPANTRDSLKEVVFEPDIYAAQHQQGLARDTHNGIFKTRTFIISNHADELTVWTPVLAAWSGGNPFLCIPCCSHDFSGQRTRFPTHPTKKTPQQRLCYGQTPFEDEQLKLSDATLSAGGQEGILPLANQVASEKTSHIRAPRPPPPAEQGSLLRANASSTHSTNTNGSQNPPKSAYATLCAYLEHLSSEIGYGPVEKEMLRIPSTRNTGILCRKWHPKHSDHDYVSVLLRREILANTKGLSATDETLALHQASRLWRERVQKAIKGAGISKH